MAKSLEQAGVANYDFVSPKLLWGVPLTLYGVRGPYKITAKTGPTAGRPQDVLAFNVGYKKGDSKREIRADITLTHTGYRDNFVTHFRQKDAEPLGPVYLIKKPWKDGATAVWQFLDVDKVPKDYFDKNPTAPASVIEQEDDEVPFQLNGF